MHETNSLSSFKTSLKLAWPISLQSMLVTILGMTDIMMVADLGDSAVASVGIANRIQFVILIILTGLASGVGILSAQYFGAGKINRIRKVIVMTVIIAAVSLLPIVVLNFYLADNVINLVTDDSEVIRLGSEYLWITMPSLLFVAVIIIFENALRGMGQVKFPMVLSTIAIVINIMLNYWLIFGGLGVEALGVLGAAWATIIARCLHAVLLVVFLAKVKHVVFPSGIRWSMLSKRQEWSSLIALVWPMMISFGVWSLGTFVYQLIFGRMGTTELAVMSLLAPVEGLLISFFFGFSSVCSILVGQRLGRDDFNEAWLMAKNYVICAPIVTLVMAFMLIQLEVYIFKPFSALSANTLVVAHDVFILLALGTCIKVFNMTLSMGVLRAGGDNKSCMVIDFTGMWVISIPLTFLAAFYFSLPLFWVACVAYSEEICKAFMFVIRMRKRFWLRNLTEIVSESKC